MIKSRRMYNRVSTRRKLSTEIPMTGLDYCEKLRNFDLSDEELAEQLDLPIGKIRKMRKLEYIPKDDELRRKISEL